MLKSLPKNIVTVLCETGNGEVGVAHIAEVALEPSSIRKLSSLNDVS